VSNNRATSKNGTTCPPRNQQPNSSQEMVARVRDEAKRDMEIFKNYSFANGGTKRS